MRKLITKIIIFVALMKWLGTIDIAVLISGAAAAIAIVVCVDLLLDSPSLR
ncbi:MAG: hypothetical protein HY646_01855 [Acidobacteria bacterium]|nr:hypothetical protein [Acidobacteriota bacterium]